MYESILVTPGGTIHRTCEGPSPKPESDPGWEERKAKYSKGTYYFDEEAYDAYNDSPFASSEEAYGSVKDLDSSPLSPYSDHTQSYGDASESEDA